MILEVIFPIQLMLFRPGCRAAMYHRMEEKGHSIVIYLKVEFMVAHKTKPLINYSYSVYLAWNNSLIVPNNLKIQKILLIKLAKCPKTCGT